MQSVGLTPWTPGIARSDEVFAIRPRFEVESPDRSVWILFLSNRPPHAAELDGLLSRDEVRGRDFVYGELLIGDKGGRKRRDQRPPNELLAGKMRREARHPDLAGVPLTYDEARLNNFIATLLQLQGRKLTADELEGLRKVVRTAGFSATETKLNAFGIERVTRSAFGQFGTFASLLQADHSTR